MYTRIIELAKKQHIKQIFWGVVFLLALNVLWRSVRYLLNFPLFGDEAFVANNFMVRNFWGLTRGLEHYQVVSLGYLWGTWLVSQIAGHSETALRLLSYLAGLASLFLFAQLAFKLLPIKTALLSLAVFCASYYPVRHAAEVKPYSFDMLASLCLTLAAWNFVSSAPSRRSFAWWAAACALCAWFSYPSIFVSIGTCLAVILFALVRQRRLLRPAITTGAIASLSFILMYLAIGQAQRAAGGDVLVSLELWASTFPPWSDPSRFFDWFVHVHLGKMFAYPNGGNNGGSVLTFALFCLGAWTLWRHDRPLKVLLLLSPFPLMFIAASLEAYPYGGSARVAQHVAPAICLLAATGLAFLLRLRPGDPLEKRGWVVITVLGVVILAGLGRDIVKPYKELADADNREVVEVLARAATADEQWIVFGAWGENTEGAPDLYHWAGSAARLRYYLLRQGRVRWAPAVEELEEIKASRWLLMAYHHPVLAFPQRAFDRYVESISQSFDILPPVSHPFREGAEQLIIYELISKSAEASS